MKILRKTRLVLPVLLVVLALTGTLVLTGCDTNGPGQGMGHEFSPVGTWAWVGGHEWGQVDMLTFTFHANGTHTLVESWGGYPSSNFGTWSLSDRVISIVFAQGIDFGPMWEGLFIDDNRLLFFGEDRSFIFFRR